MVRKERGEEEKQERLETREGGLGFPIHWYSLIRSADSGTLLALTQAPPTSLLPLYTVLSFTGQLLRALRPPCYDVAISPFLPAPFTRPGTAARSEVCGSGPS